MEKTLRNLVGKSVEIIVPFGGNNSALIYGTLSLTEWDGISAVAWFRLIDSRDTVEFCVNHVEKIVMGSTIELKS